jgi:hypothetical protein
LGFSVQDLRSRVWRSGVGVVSWGPLAPGKRSKSVVIAGSDDDGGDEGANLLERPPDANTGAVLMSADMPWGRNPTAYCTPTP